VHEKAQDVLLYVDTFVAHIYSSLYIIFTCSMHMSDTKAEIVTVQKHNDTQHYCKKFSFKG